MIEVLKVSSKSNPNSVAGALAGVIRGCGTAEIQVVGAGALNQAIKAIAIARGYMAVSGADLTCQPTFADIEIEGEGRTAIRLVVDACEPRQAGPGAAGRPARRDSAADRGPDAPAETAAAPRAAAPAEPAGEQAMAPSQAPPPA